MAGLAAGLLRFQVLDTDRVIEERAGRRISDIFATDGESAFREKEAALVLELETAEERVIATGGGLPMNPANFESLRKHAFVVCLWASPETIYQRVQFQGHRPLLPALAEHPLDPQPTLDRRTDETLDGVAHSLDTTRIWTRAQTPRYHHPRWPLTRSCAPGSPPRG